MDQERVEFDGQWGTKATRWNKYEDTELPHGLGSVRMADSGDRSAFTCLRLAGNVVVDHASPPPGAAPRCGAGDARGTHEYILTHVSWKITPDYLASWPDSWADALDSQSLSVL